MLVSIQLNSNRPDTIIEFVQNVEETASNPAQIEIIFNIDLGDEKCRNILEDLKSTSKLHIKYLETDIIKHYKDLWKPLNELLKLTDSNAYFVTNFSDEFRFKTKGWDEILKKYIGYYEDDIFRIRLSRYRFRNYTDFWECVYAPDSLAFYTKKWMDTVGTWCPCLGPDSWQQLVAFYLTNSRKFDHIQYNRDIAENFIKFEGEGASIGLTGLKARQRIKDNVDLWFETVSHEMQEKAKYAAATLQTAIILHENSNPTKLSQNFVSNRKPPIFDGKKISEISSENNIRKKRIEFFYNKNLIYKIDYSLSKLKLFLINNIRKPNYGYFAGGGQECFRKDFVSQVNVYFRMRKYGAFGNRRKTISKPEFLKKYNLNFLWTPIKILWVICELAKLLFFKGTGSKKYCKLIKIKICNVLNKYKKSKFLKKNGLSFLWIPIKIVWLALHQVTILFFKITRSEKYIKPLKIKICNALNKYKKYNLLKKNGLSFLWVPIKISLVALHLINDTILKSLSFKIRQLFKPNL